MAEKIQTKCPSCGVGLTMTVGDHLIGKLIKCPSCGVSSPYSKFKRLKPAPEEKTEIAGLKFKYTVRLVDTATGKEYPVSIGNHLVGRKTYKTEPPADIPIETEDMGFSPSHFNLKVTEGVDGLNHAYISNASNKNQTKINGTPLEGEDMISLRNGDIISSARTELRFEMIRIFE